MTDKISRKDFLKKTALGTGTAMVSAPALLEAAHQEELATLIDLRKCIGCESCVYACQEANAEKYPVPVKPIPKMIPEKVKIADWSEKQDVTDRLTPYNWLYIQNAEVTHNNQNYDLYIPRRCMHCQEAPCAHLCPFGAAHKHSNGITTIESDMCLGGAKCKAVCPWHIPERQSGVGPYLNMAPSLAGNGVMYKCDRCYDKVKDGEQPACIEACPENVQKIGPRSEILKEAHAIAAEIGGYIYGEHENGGTNTIYVSPVPFDKINGAIEKGPGRPHMAKTESVMGKTDMLAAAIAIAPLAGLAANFSRTYKKVKELWTREEKNNDRKENIA